MQSFFLQNLKQSFVWVDADAYAVQGLSNLMTHLERGRGRGLIVANRRDGGPRNFNAGFFVALPPAYIDSWESLLDDKRESLEQHISQEHGEVIGHLPEEWNWTTYWSTGLSEPNDGKGPRIIHATGPIKPWHLHPRLWGRCIQGKCDWAPWFDEYLSLSRILENPSDTYSETLTSTLNFSRSSRYVHRSTIVFRTINLIGHLPSVIVSMLDTFRPRLPRNDFHPLH